MFRTLVPKFRFLPDKAHRYFTLKYTLKEDSFSAQQQLKQQYLKNLHTYEQQNSILFAGMNGKTYYYLFAGEDESVPYYYMKKGPMREHIGDYEIQEIEMKLRMLDKELAPKYLRE